MVYKKTKDDDPLRARTIEKGRDSMHMKKMASKVPSMWTNKNKI